MRYRYDRLSRRSDLKDGASPAAKHSLALFSLCRRRRTLSIPQQLSLDDGRHIDALPRRQRRVVLHFQLPPVRKALRCPVGPEKGTSPPPLGGVQQVRTPKTSQAPHNDFAHPPHFGPTTLHESLHSTSQSPSGFPRPPTSRHDPPNRKSLQRVTPVPPPCLLLFWYQRRLYDGGKPSSQQVAVGRFIEPAKPVCQTVPEPVKIPSAPIHVHRHGCLKRLHQPVVVQFQRQTRRHLNHCVQHIHLQPRPRFVPQYSTLPTHGSQHQRVHRLYILSLHARHARPPDQFVLLKNIGRSHPYECRNTSGRKDPSHPFRRSNPFVLRRTGHYPCTHRQTRPLGPTETGERRKPWPEPAAAEMTAEAPSPRVEGRSTLDRGRPHGNLPPERRGKVLLDLKRIALLSAQLPPSPPDIVPYLKVVVEVDRRLDIEEQVGAPSLCRKEFHLAPPLHLCRASNHLESPTKEFPRFLQLTRLRQHPRLPEHSERRTLRRRPLGHDFPGACPVDLIQSPQRLLLMVPIRKFRTPLDQALGTFHVLRPSRAVMGFSRCPRRREYEFAPPRPIGQVRLDSVVLPSCGASVKMVSFRVSLEGIDHRFQRIEPLGEKWDHRDLESPVQLAQQANAIDDCPFRAGPQHRLYPVHRGVPHLTSP